ncbi:hypothetical protein [uncultured Croceitalea sp.]|uniref:hypothetical protein n=1 Tax=uncultured Croceitalea sp. TaxID=1798908 RepID=UPI00330665AF
MEYKVVPFVASIDQNKGTSTDVAEQLEELINKAQEQGWKYVRLESVTTYVQADNGCFGIGGRPGYTTTKQMIVFQG